MLCSFWFLPCWIPQSHRDAQRVSFRSPQRPRSRLPAQTPSRRRHCFPWGVETALWVCVSCVDMPVSVCLTLVAVNAHPSVSLCMTHVGMLNRVNSCVCLGSSEWLSVCLSVSLPATATQMFTPTGATTPPPCFKFSLNLEKMPSTPAEKLSPSTSLNVLRGCFNL